MLVRDWMTANPISVTSSTPVLEAHRLMRDGNFRRLPVVDKGVLVGIVTDRDLRDASPSKATTLSVFELNYLLSKLTVGKVMTSPVYTVGPDDRIETAALLMSQRKLSGLPVVEDGTVIGILTITDLLDAFVNLLALEEGGAIPNLTPRT